MHSLLPKQKLPGESWIQNYWHRRHKCICHATTPMSVEWQTQRFIQTASVEAVP